jgi:hypothetical protein
VDDAFEPPKYISSLIAAANDGAKSAQTGALAFSLVGLYLLATAFSTTDEDLLLEHTVSVSQIGVQVPVVFSFAIAPAVFLFLHAYTLIRYDMLAANLRQFRTDLQVWIPREADRERSRQLLANVEFVQARTAPRSSGLHSWLYRVVAWLVLAGFPVATLIAVQISSLRYQSNVVSWTQRLCIGLDLALLLWFFYRQRRREEPSRNPYGLRSARHWVPSLLAIAVVVVVDLLYLNVPGRDEGSVSAGAPLNLLKFPLAVTEWGTAKWAEAYRQPLDFVLCPALRWGCRYLVVDHRTLVGHVWNTQAVAVLRGSEANQNYEMARANLNEALAGIEGVFLRGRTLRFADFDESRLYGADLISADLSGATLNQAQLQKIRGQTARLIRANLEGANLLEADLSNGDLSGARLSAANLSGAILSGAILSGAILRGTILSEADLSGATLWGANLSKANLLTVRHVTQGRLNEACGDSETKLPPGLTIPDCDSKAVGPDSRPSVNDPTFPE